MSDFVTRPQWGSLDTKPAQNPGPKSHLVVHHVAGRRPNGRTDEERHMRELQAFAINTKGYTDMDYNVLVGPSGTRYEGRGRHARSAATLDFNTGSRAVCLMGNLDTTDPTPEQVEGLVVEAVAMVLEGALAADFTLIGHFENPAHPNATICPGRRMIPLLDDVRQRIVAFLKPAPPIETPDPTPQEADEMLVFHVTDRERSGREMVLTLNGSGDPQVLSFDGAPDDRDATLRAIEAERGRSATPLVVRAATFDRWAALSTKEDG